MIWNIIEDTKELSEETKRDIIKGREQYEKGQYTTLSNLKKKYNIR